MLHDILQDDQWQMSPGERAALKGILGDLRPSLAIEIGTGDGGSLKRIAAAAEHVHAFDVADPPEAVADLANVTFHTGDSHELLPGVLAEFARSGVNVDFALVDGDHTSAGVRRDLEDLLGSPAVAHSLIVLHDTANPEVREGLDAVDYAARSKVAWVDLDWVPGFLFQEGPSRGEAWGGIGIVLIDADRDPVAAAGGGAVTVASYAYPTAALLAEATPPSVRRARPASAGWLSRLRRG